MTTMAVIITMALIPSAGFLAGWYLAVNVRRLRAVFDAWRLAVGLLVIRRS